MDKDRYAGKIWWCRWGNDYDGLCNRIEVEGISKGFTECSCINIMYIYSVLYSICFEEIFKMNEIMNSIFYSSNQNI